MHISRSPIKQPQQQRVVKIRFLRLIERKLLFLHTATTVRDARFYLLAIKKYETRSCGICLLNLLNEQRE